MDWRRDDTGYAAAAVAAAGFVVYLMAANFGLVPSPLGILGGTSAQASIGIAPGVGEPDTDGNVPAVAAAPTSAPASAPLTQEPVDVLRDVVAPAIAFSTEDGANFGVVEPATVKGRASDLDSGVDKVLVTFSSGGNEQVVVADITCEDASRRVCTWTAMVPGVLANYTVVAHASDRAGNVADCPPIAVTVVNTGAPLKQVTDTVEPVPSALTTTVDNLLTFLLGP